MTQRYKSNILVYVLLLTVDCIFSLTYYCTTNFFFLIDWQLYNILKFWLTVVEHTYTLSWLTVCWTAIFSVTNYCTTVIGTLCSGTQVLTTSRCWVTLSTLWRPLTLHCMLRSYWGWRRPACTLRGYWSGLYPHIYEISQRR